MDADNHLPFSLNSDTVFEICRRQGIVPTAANLSRISGSAYPSVLAALTQKKAPRFETALAILGAIGLSADEINQMAIGDVLPVSADYFSTQKE